MNDISIDSKRSNNPEALIALAEEAARQAEVLAGVMQGEGNGGPEKITEGIVSQIGGPKALNLSAPVAKASMVGMVREISGTPEIDEPDSDAAKEADLEQLMAYLMLDQSEEQAKRAEERIKSLLSKMQSERDNTIGKLKNMISIAMEQAERQRNANILGWFMTALAAVVMIASSIVTLGAATPLAIAGFGFALLGTAMSITMQALTSSGKMQKMIEDRAREMQEKDPSLSFSDAMAKAQNEATIITTTISVILAVGSLSCGVASLCKAAAKTGADAAAKAAAKAAEEGTKNTVMETIKNALRSTRVQLGAKITSVVGGVANTGMGVGATVSGFKMIDTAKEVAERQAQMLEAQKILDATEEAMEKEETVLKSLVEQIQDCYEVIGDLLGRNSEFMTRVMSNLNRTGV